MSLRTKLLGAFWGIALILLASGTAAYYSSWKVINQFDHILRVNAAQERTVSLMRDAAKDEIRQISKLSFSQAKNSDFEVIYKKIDALRAQYRASESQLLKLLEEDGEKKTFQELKAVWGKLDASVDEFMSLFKNNAHNPDRLKLVQIYYNDLDELVDELFANVVKMEKQVRDSSDAWQQRAIQASEEGNRFMIGAVALGFILSIVAGFTLSGRLAHRLNRVVYELTEQARGMIAIATQIVENGDHFLERAKRQSEVIEKTVASTMQIDSLVQQNAVNARASADKSKESQHAVEGGRHSIRRLTEAMVEINSSTREIAGQVRDTHHRMNEIVKMIEDIARRTQVIHEIVFQTKLLSFNASVEAARAGEAGRGFSVVAEEVGILAHSSGSAASEIGKLLTESIASVESMVRETSSRVEELLIESERKAKLGADASVDCTTVFEKVVSDMNDILQRIGEISYATQEEVGGLSSVKESIVQLEGLAGENRTAVKTFEGSAASLKSQSDLILDAVHSLEEILNGRPAA